MTGRKSLPAKALSSLSPQIKETEKETELKEKLQRQLTWERETPFLQATSSPIASITDGLGQISLDEVSFSNNFVNGIINIILFDNIQIVSISHCPSSSICR